MFERFTDRARRTVVLAQEAARDLGHNYVGTEHVLLGLIGEGEGVAAQVLTDLGLSTEFIRSRVEDIVGRGEHASSGHLPFTPRSKKVLELGLREALLLGHNYIGTEHLLLGLVREGSSKATEILAEKVELVDIRSEVLRVLATYAPAKPEAVLTQEQARTALLGEQDASSAMDAALVCMSALDLLPPGRHRRAALSFLASWYGDAS